MSVPARAVYHTALAIVPPSAATACWDQVQDTRRTLRDKGFYRWPPHVNLVYPFVESDRFEELAVLLTRELAVVEPFDVQLERFGTFGGGKKGVCYLVPGTDPSDRINRLYERVHGVVSQLMPCPEVARFIPHMTVAHTPTAGDARAAAEATEPHWHPTSFHVEEIYILLRSPPDDQYSIACRIPLGVGLERADDAPTAPTIAPPLERFEKMPTEEEEWVKDIAKQLSRKGKFKKI